MPYLTTEDRLGSHASAGPMMATSTFVQGTGFTKRSTAAIREETTNAWLTSRFKDRGDSERMEPPSYRTIPVATLKHRVGTRHGYPVTAVAFNHAGDLFATASNDVRLYDTTTGRLRAILDGHGGLVRCLAFTPDGRLLVTGADDCAALVWSMEACLGLCEKGVVVTLTPPGGPSSTNPLGLQARPGGSLAPGGSPGTTTYGLVGAPPGTVRTAATNAAATAAAKSGATALSTAAAAAYAVMCRVVQRALRRHHRPVLSLAVTPDSKAVVTGSADKTIRIWDVDSGHCVATLRGHLGGVNALAVTPTGRTIVSGGADRAVCVWDFATGECQRIMRGHTGAVSCMAMSRGGQWVVTGGVDKTLRVWDLANGNELATLADAHGGQFGVLSCAVSGDGSTIMSGGYDCLVKLWDAHSGLPLSTLDGHRHMVGAVAFSPDSTTVLTAGRDDDVRLWIWAYNHTAMFWNKKTIAWETAHPAETTALREGREMGVRPNEQRENRHWGCLFGPSSGVTGGLTADEQETYATINKPTRRAASASRRPRTAPTGPLPGRPLPWG